MIIKKGKIEKSITKWDTFRLNRAKVIQGFVDVKLKIQRAAKLYKIIALNKILYKLNSNLK